MLSLSFDSANSVVSVIIFYYQPGIPPLPPTFGAHPGATFPPKPDANIHQNRHI